MAPDAGRPIEESAAGLLQSYWESSDLDTPADLAEDAVELRARYALVPDEVSRSVGLTVLAVATLRAHVVEEYGDESRYQWADDLELFPGLDGDEDGVGLADEVVHAARRTLALDPANNLAAFALGYALEWLGEHRAAADAYQEALRFDGSDEPARFRVRALDAVEPAREPDRPRYTHGFFLVEMTHMTNNNGDLVGRTWLLTDPVAVRAAVDDYFSEWLRDFNEELSSFAVEIHGPEHDPTYLDLTKAMRGDRVDWSSVDLPDAVAAPLPVGRPIRRDGEMRFFGATEHWV